MDYNFKYESKHPRKTLSQKKNKILSDLLYYLYDQRWFKRLKLDNDFTVRSGKFVPPDDKFLNDIVYDGIKVESVLFSDIILIEKVNDFKKQIIKVINEDGLKPLFLQSDAKKVFGDSFDEIDSEYSTVSFGTVYRGKPSAKIESDLIGSVHIGYIKCAESCVIVNYRIYPTEKFNQLLKVALEQSFSMEHELMDVKFRDFLRLKKGSFIRGRHIKSKGSEYWTRQLFNELNYHLKSVILKKLKVGYFKRHPRLLFPYITTYEFEEKHLKKYQDRLFRNISHFGSVNYSSKGLRLTVDYSDFKDYESNCINILLAKRKADELDHGFNSVDNLSQRYESEIIPKFMLTNLAALKRLEIVQFRKQVFNHLRRNKSTLFLTKTLKLKNKLTLSFIEFNRVRKDILEDERLNSSNPRIDDVSIPDSFGSCGASNCSKKHEFKQELKKSCNDAVADTKKSFKDLSKLFQTITEDNQSRANMRLQRLLFWFAIVGIILTIYGTNVDFFNEWLNKLLK